MNPKTKLSRINQILNRLPQAVYTHVADLTVEAWVTREPVSFADRQTGEYKELKPGGVWGELWDCAWFHFTGVVPDQEASVVLLIDLNGEGLVVDSDGSPRQGLTSISSGFDFSLGKPGKRVVPYEGPKQVDLWVEGGLNDLFGSLRNGGRLEEARIAVRRENVQALCFDFEVLRELLDQLDPKKARYAAVLQALYEASVILTSGITDEAADQARRRLEPELAKRGGSPSLTISAIGHAHIDLAWLWPIRETIRKGARTFATVLRMMERYPDYVFGASQPQLYQWMKDYYPSLYAEIKERVAEGRWEVQGAMWVEPDANVPSGEALVRQILYGKRFYRQEFGKDVTNLWMPDVFGYSGSIPQLLRKAGVDTFMTQKLSWSTFNQHPHHTFHWEGIDGSSVLVHMPPEATYNSSAAPRAIAKAENEYLDKDVSEHCLLLFGIGDGGGGPGEEHLERLAREQDLDGLSPVKQEFSEVFFDKLKAGSERYARWRGELYLERHQGTLTSQARNKRFNRKIEIALREAEIASVRAMLAGHEYPQADLERIWKEVLLLQFHDILPGSSITRVFDESRARYQVLLEEVESITEKADRAVYGHGSETVAINSLSWPRIEWVTNESGWHFTARKPLSSAHNSVIEERPIEVSASIEALENERLRVRFDEQGHLISVFDKASELEYLKPESPSNCLTVYEDPGDAWDFAHDYSNVPAGCFELVAQEAYVDGPEAVLKQTRRFGASTLVQEIVVTARGNRIDFRTKVDWREDAKMLRTSFPVAVNAPTARCEIQYGSIDRPTHGNTSWDWAQSEVCAQKWVDIFEGRFGVALLNDCKYGYSIKGGVLDLNLLRSPSYPDPAADRGEHEFTYALHPYTNNLRIGVIQEAYKLNMPMRILENAADVPETPPLLEVHPINVVVEAIKKAEDSDAVIVRIYECVGTPTRATVKLGFPVTSAAIVDLMEENDQPVPIGDGPIALEFGPFEILTLKLGR